MNLGELLFKELNDLLDSFFGLIVTSTASMLLVFGWFMTSETAQKLIRNSKLIVWMLTAGLITTFLSMMFMHFRLYDTSQEIARLIPETDYFPNEKYYSYKILRLRTVIVMELAQLALITFFLVVLWHIYKKGSPVVSEKEVD
jgi:hypothetical protein